MATTKRGRTATAAGKATTKGRKAPRKRAAQAGKGNKAASDFMATAQGEAKAVVYVHGIGNKPPAEVLRAQWDQALFGRSMGERTRLAYWVDRQRYPVPEAGTGNDRDDGPTITPAELKVMAAMGVSPAQRDLQALAGQIAGSPEEERLLRQMLGELGVDGVGRRGPGKRGVLGKINEALLRLVSAALLQDVHDFFFVRERREAMERSLRERLESGGGPFVVVAHSQGSMIAYEVLRKLDPARCDVALLVTVGSPLGLPSVRSMFKQWTKKSKLPFPPCVRQWFNVADTADPVALDGDLKDDIERPAGRFRNLRGQGINLDSPQHPHSGSGYLAIAQVREAVREAVGPGFDQPLSNTVLIKDLSDQLEARDGEYRHETLIELERADGEGDLDQSRQRLLAQIRELAGASTGLQGEALDEAIRLEDGLQRFVSARLTRFEIERLRDAHQPLKFKRLWRDAQKRALINQSPVVVQADAAHNAYRALGRKIGWAVLDTGIAASHPHFYEAGKKDVVAAQWDCTVRGAPKKRVRADGDAFSGMDRDGHGTHVAGIIAGSCSAPLPGGETASFGGIAPEARLYGFKVLDDEGLGHDSYIIKALQQIGRINDSAGELLIHGVNLSLGGPFDAESYGCGFTPVCNELRRLWRQGVLVVLAAGNEGTAWLLQADGSILPANMDLSIGDPANLEESIVVGSVHKSNPHTYGVSYFSSRGPTADGRGKPDVVAPGEKILSAHHGFSRRKRDSWMVEMSGTSMAAPHVSGLLAAFLSARREFIGAPDRVKRILLEHCTDIGRDPYMQGRGIPNLVRMLGAT
ncbi:peptidase [Pseudoxanthomonas kalamensis DSM 18571]|uniref:S8 family peptidase n=1 Tax=Pseudoxanthomonas kalamensis TaxID=289483 RepID=UPI0013911AB2|nr:S8 family peptidase [Pseudoxanthomonas kalamensis]KAF1709878.1 peptidase [Pseudoxanthomonas kalamensis DSM 18571]